MDKLYFSQFYLREYAEKFSNRLFRLGFGEVLGKWLAFTVVILSEQMVQRKARVVGPVSAVHDEHFSDSWVEFSLRLRLEKNTLDLFLRIVH